MKKMLFGAIAVVALAMAAAASSAWAQGVPQGPDVGWRPSKSLPNQTFSIRSALSMDVEGNAHILQRLQGYAGESYSIYYTNTRLENRGSDGFMPGVRVDGYGGGSGKDTADPDLFVDPQDRVHAVWSRGDSDGNHSWANVCYAVLNFQGGVVGGIQTITTAGNSEYFSAPQIVVTDTGTIHIVLIHEPPLGADSEIRHLTKSPGGGWTSTLISTQRGAGSVRIGYRTGKLCAVWDNPLTTINNGIFTSSIDLAGGGSWSAKAQIATGSHSDPDVDVDTQGNTHFVWRTDGGGVSYSKNGAAGPAVSSNTSAGRPRVRVASGWIHVLYSYSGFTHAWKADSSATWDHREPIDGTPSSTVMNDLTISSNTDLHLVSDKYYKRSKSSPPDGVSMVPAFPGGSVNIVPLNGSLAYRLSLFTAKGVGPTASLGLSYDSKEITAGDLGPGWTMDHLMHVASDGDDGVVLVLPNGLRFSFTPQGGNSYGLADVGFGFIAQIMKVTQGWDMQVEGGRTYRFNTAGKLGSVFDPTGNEMRVDYVAGRPSRIVDMLWNGTGRSTLFEYVGDRMSAVVDPLGGRYEFGYTNGRLSTVTFAGVAVLPTFEFEYNTAGMISRVIPPEGYVASTKYGYTISYDGAGRVESVVDPLENIAAGSGALPAPSSATFQVFYNQETTFQFPSKFHTRVQNRRGASSVYVFDAANKFGVIEFWDATALTANSGILPVYRTYDSFGNTTSVVDRWGGATNTTYWPPNQAPALWLTGLVHTVTRQLSSSQSAAESFTYVMSNAFGNVETHTVTVTPTGGAAVNRMTTFHYDAFGRLTETLYPDVTPPAGPPQSNIKTVNVYKATSPFQLIQTKDEETRTTTFASFHLVHGLPGTTLREGGSEFVETAYDNLGNVTATKAPRGGAGSDSTKWNDPTDWTYTDLDGLYRVWRVRDPLGYATINQYDRESRLISVQPPGTGGPTTTQYDRRGFVKGGGSPDGNWTQFVDANGNVTLRSSIRPIVTEKTETDYDVLDRVIEVRVPGGGFVGGGGPTMRTQTLYDQQLVGGERYIRQTQFGTLPADNRVTDTFVDVSGRTVRVEGADAKKTVVHTFYDEKSQVVATNRYFNNVFQTSTVNFRDARDRVDRVRVQDVPYPTVPGQNNHQSETVTLYNAAGAVVEVRDPLRQAGQPGHKTTNVLDARHRVQFVVDGLGQIVRENVWGDDDLLTEVKVPDPATKSTSLVRSEWKTYTARKELKRVENRNGFGLSYVYNAIKGQVDRVTDAANRVTRTTYDSATQRVDEVIVADGITIAERRTRSVWDAGLLKQVKVYNPQTAQHYGSIYTYSYDKADRLEKVQAPLVADEVHSYDEFGAEKVVVLGGKTLTHGYNFLGQRKSTDWSGTHSASEIRTYNGIGQLESVASQGREKTMLYDVWLGTPAVEIFKVGAQTWKTQTHASDVAKNYTNLLDAANCDHKWVYDENNRVKEIRFQNQSVSEIFYTVGGLVDRTVLKNESGAPIAETLHLYDGRGRKVRQVTTVPGTGKVLAGFEWGYDDLDLVRLIKVDHLGVKADLAYNERRELIEEIWSGNSGGAGMPAYTNQIGGAGGQQSATPSPFAQSSTASVPAVQGTTRRYGFDPAGNRKFTEVDGQTTNFIYNNPASQLDTEDGPTTDVAHLYDEWGNEKIRTTTGGTSLTETYQYNYLNQLSVYLRAGVASGQYDYWPTGERYSKVTASGTELYVPRHGDVGAEYSDAATLKNVYVQGTGIDQKQIRIAAGADKIINAGDVRRHYLGDQVGTVSMTLSDAGAMVESNLKDVWGMPITQTASAERYGFAQREQDTESGLVHMRARQYDPRIGRFTQTDPVLANRAAKHYAYAGNNPVSMVDPMGLDDSPYSLKNWWEDLKGLVGLSSAGTWNGLAGTGGQRGWEAGKAGVLRPSMHAAEIAAGGIIGEGLAATSIIVRSAVQGTFLALEETAYRGVIEGEVPTAKGFATEAAINSVGGMLIEGTFALGGKAWSGMTQKGPSKLDQLIEKFRNPFPAEEVPNGSFSITEEGWTGYPTNIPRPKGPFRLLAGAEYEEARDAASAANQSIRDAANLKGAKIDIHEVKPVKWGGDPVSPENKILISRELHQKEVTPWWNRLQKTIEKDVFQK